MDLIDSIGKKKVFTKIDLRLWYNNVRIKEEDELKAVFLMLEGSFEPTVMFFGLTNSPAMFQVMMNDLLRDLVMEEKIAVFIDDVMIVKIINGGLYFIVSFYFILFFFYFSIFRTTRVRVYQSHCHIK